MSSDPWPYLQLLSGTVTGMIAVVGILFRFRDEASGRLTRWGWAAVAAALLTTVITLYGIGHADLEARNAAEAVAAERKTEAERYAALLRESHRTIAEIRRGLQPIEQWRISFTLSLPLDMDDPQEAAIHGVILERLGAIEGSRERRSGGLTTYADDLEPLLREAGVKPFSSLYQLCDLNLGILFVAQPVTERVDLWPEAPAELCHSSAAPDAGWPIEYDIGEQAFRIDTRDLALAEFVRPESAPVRSIHDLAGKTMLLLGWIGDDDREWRIDRVWLDYGSPLFTQHISGRALRAATGSGERTGIAFPCGAAAPCDDEAFLAWIQQHRLMSEF